MTRKTRIVVLSLTAAFSATDFIALAGDLNPPAGPVAPTQRTPIGPNTTPGDADSLFKITLPGSYYLTGNVTGVAAKHGIEIAADGVTLDLAGHALIGVAGSLDGINTAVNGLVVKDGTIKDWGRDGLHGNSLSNALITDLVVLSNASWGIVVNTGCQLVNCVSNQNGQSGLISAARCTFVACTAIANGGVGIQAATGSLVSACTVGNNGSFGMALGNFVTVTGCVVQVNNSDGINGGQGCTITNNTVAGSTNDGIDVASDSLISGNNCALNGTAGDGDGIHVTGSDNRIEGNNCTDADRGIDVNVAGNIIIRNTCATNTTDWTIAANNVFGPIVDRRAPASAAVSGFSAASSLGSTEPNANFSY